jgi:hypothetical protein
MAWAGTGLVWGLNGGIPTSFSVSRLATLTDEQRKSIFFAQISDSHIGFAKDANKNVTATLQEAVAKLNALPQNPVFVLHTPATSPSSRSRTNSTRRAKFSKA